MSIAFANHQVRSLLERHQLADEGTFMGGDVGALLSSEKGGRQVRRLELEGEVFFLKRCQREPPMVSMLLFGRWPAAGALREVAILRELSGAGFLAMEPAAWGEVRRMGLPRGGFILVRGVAGEDVAKRFDRSSGPEKRRLLRQMGELVGRLHGAGFFHPVRLKDLILSADGMHLIDRETSKPWPKKWFTLVSCVRSVARAVRRTLRDGHRIGAGSAVAFLRGYHAGLGKKRGDMGLRELTGKVMAGVRKEMLELGGR